MIAGYLNLRLSGKLFKSHKAKLLYLYLFGNLPGAGRQKKRSFKAVLSYEEVPKTFNISEMKKLWTSLLLSFALIPVAHAQDDLFGTPEREARKGFIITLNGNFDIPAADMADRFGLNYRVGPGLLYKTKSNWVFGVKTDFIFGNKIKEKGFLSNLMTENEGIIALNGIRSNVNFFERGYLAGFQAGKILNFSAKNPDNGLLLLTSAGFIQHKILINTSKSGNISQLEGDYKKGYDRLVNGWYLEQFAGYTYFSKSGLINFNIGLDVLAGFTQGRRNYLIDVQKPGNEKRLDILYGIRGSWYIPVYKRKSDDLYFD